MSRGRGGLQHEGVLGTRVYFRGRKGTDCCRHATWRASEEPGGQPARQVGQARRLELTARWAAQPRCSTCAQVGQAKAASGPLPSGSTSQKHTGQASVAGHAGGHWRAGSAEPLRSGRGRQCRVWGAGRHAVYSSCLQRSAVADHVPRAALAGGPHAGGFQAVRKRPKPVDFGLAICNCMWPGSAAWTRGKEGQSRAVSAVFLTTGGTGCHTRGLNPKLNRRRVVRSWATEAGQGKA